MKIKIADKDKAFTYSSEVIPLVGDFIKFTGYETPKAFLVKKVIHVVNQYTGFDYIQLDCEKYEREENEEN